MTTLLDRLIPEVDKVLRTLFAPATSQRPMPGAHLPEAELTEADKRHVAALMRINHCGEICAQALYQGQALTSRDPATRQTLAQAAAEETEHLNWTGRRIDELGGRKSLLNPLWYAGALGIGLVAGKLGDDWNLGFLAETERQVTAHLDRHQTRLPAEDEKSRALLAQMAADESQHAQTARQLGARELPPPVKAAMRCAARVMTTTAYYL